MGVFLTAEWRKLIMVQYEVAPEVLAPYMPLGVEMDLFEGRCFVSLVGFLFDRVRVKGVGFPMHTRFEEVNLRFYVRRAEADGSVRRGVVFVREFVPRAAIAVVARTLYDEPYETVPTRYSLFSGDGEIDVRYDWQRGKHADGRPRWNSVGVKAVASSQPIAAGSVEEFITEHYWGYTKRRDRSTSEYEVRHPRWEVYPVRECIVEADFGAMYGAEWAFLNATPVANALLAEGSAVQVMGGKRIA